MSSRASPLPRHPVRAVIFDLDDTLLSSGHLESFRLSRNQRGLEEALPGLRAPDGLHQQLHRLSQALPLGIVTTAPRWYAERILAHLYPDIAWQALVTYADVQRRKPDPQGLLLALSQMKLEPSTEVAYVGDQESDLEAARRAGLLPVHAAWCAQVGPGQELSLHHPAELDCLQPVRGAVSNECVRLLTLLQLPGVGRTTALNTLAGQDLGLGDLPRDPRLAKALQQPGAWEKASDAAQQVLAASAALDVHLLCPADAEYPPALLGMGKEQPALLYVQGRLSTLPGLAIIGTREPTRHGLEVTRRITTHFVPDHSIVSGLALGVDSKAHQAALQAGGHTVAVLGHGHGQVFPRQNSDLAIEILESGGALVSEYPPHTPVLPHYFVERDRIQAGLAGATIMVQTGVQGGSWHAARKALSYGRLLGYPVPTERDLRHAEDKIQGILLLEQGTAEQKAAHLKCRESDLQRVFRIRGKEDYLPFSAAANVTLT